MPSAERAEPVSDAQAAALFSELTDIAALVIAVSGGPDSVALLALLARWRASLAHGPTLTAVTVDHGLRPESRHEAAAVKTLAASLGVPHRTVRWRGDKPKTRVQEAARDARYRLLAEDARRDGARHIAVAHTLDDQAETVLFRLARGSGIAGVAAMAPLAPLPTYDKPEITLVRPLLGIPKSRLLATLTSLDIPFADDLSNRDPRFARPRLRQIARALAAEGLDAAALAQFATRARRANSAIDWLTDDIAAGLPSGWQDETRTCFPREQFLQWPDEAALRLLRNAIVRAGDEGPVELAKLEALFEALKLAARTGQGARFRRTLAGAAIALTPAQVTVERAPTRRNSGSRSRK